MENFKNKSFFWAFIILWGGLILWNAFTPAREFSEAENRFLKVFPKFTGKTLLDGNFMEDVNVYLNDQFAGRPYWVGMQSMIEYGTGKREINGVYIGKDGMLFGKIAEPDADITAKNIAGINAFAGKYGMPVYVALIPSSTEIQKENLPKFAAGWDEKSYIDGVYEDLGANVTPVDIYGVLSESKKNYIYYRTDHHWTGYGAHLGYHGLSMVMWLNDSGRDGLQMTDVSDSFYGTYHSKTGFPLAKPEVMKELQFGEVKSFEIYNGKETTTRDSIYFNEFLDKKDKYSYFLGQVQPIVTIKTASETDKKLIIFKDSYAHSLVPMMLGDFSEIRLVDLRFVNPMTIGELLEAANYDEALFIYSTDVFSHQLGAGMLSY